jgi:hypothetical protein
MRNEMVRIPWVLEREPCPQGFMPLHELVQTTPQGLYIQYASKAPGDGHVEAAIERHRLCNPHTPLGGGCR